MANKSNFRAGRNQDALSENVELLTGQRGDGLDRAITLRELNNLGLAGLTRIGGVYTSKSGITVGQTQAGVVDFPVKPLNVVASGAFNTILITWDEPNYRSHAYAEIWRAETDNLAVAVNIGSCTANVYADAIGGDAHVYYWVRFVNRNDVKGPYNATEGTYAETGVDITQLLASLTNQITSDQLTQELLTPIQAVPGIEADVQVNAAAIATTNATYSAQWSVKTTVAGLNGGFGIYNDGANTRFTVVANRFAIVDSSLGATAFVPFVVDSGRVIIDTAFIKQAWIESLAAAQVTADKIATLSLYSVTITGGSLALGWKTPQISALYLMYATGLACLFRMNAGKACVTFLHGAQDILPASLTVGLGRSVVVLMTQADITDTIVYEVSRVLAGKGAVATLLCAYLFVTALNFFTRLSDSVTF